MGTGSRDVIERKIYFSTFLYIPHTFPSRIPALPALP
jgi:hypothetical protein